MNAPKLHDVAAAAAAFGISPATVRKYTRSGKVRWAHTRIGNRVLFTDAQLEAIIAAGAVKPAARRAS